MRKQSLRGKEKVLEMSEISVIGNAIPGNAQSPPAAPTKPVEVNAPSVDHVETERTDCVDFSQQALLLEKLQQLPNVRQEKIDAIKQAIANNSYLTDDKLDLAINRMIDEIEL